MLFECQIKVSIEFLQKTHDDKINDRLENLNKKSHKNTCYFIRHFTRLIFWLRNQFEI